MKQHSLGGFNSKPVEKLGVFERELNHLSHLGYLVSEPTNIFVADSGYVPFRLGNFFTDCDSSPRIHDNGVCAWRDMSDLQIDSAIHYWNRDDHSFRNYA